MKSVKVVIAFYTTAYSCNVLKIDGESLCPTSLQMFAVAEWIFFELLTLVQSQQFQK